MLVLPWAGVASLSGKVVITMQSLSHYHYTVVTQNNRLIKSSSSHLKAACCFRLVADLDSTDVDADFPS